MNKITNAMTATEKAASSFTYGDVIKHTWLAENLGVDIPEHGTRQQIQTSQLDFLGAFETMRYELLTTYQMYLVSVRGEGYRIVYPSEQVDVVMAQLSKRVSAEIAKASTVLQNVKNDMLSSDEKKRRDDAASKVSALEVFSNTSLRLKKE